MHRLSNLASVGCAASEAIELAKGLLSDSQTRVVYQQACNELENLRELLQLTEREVAAVSGLSPGVALWKVGQRSFVVEHLVSRAERWMVDTDPREAGARERGSAVGARQLAPGHAGLDWREEPATRRSAPQSVEQ